MLTVRMENLTINNLNKIREYVRTNPHIVFCARTSAKQNIFLNIYARNREHFSQILREFRQSFPNDIVDYDLNLSMRDIKEIFVPESIILE